MKHFPFLLFAALFQFNGSAQTVDTFGNVPSNGDVAVDAQGRVYVTSESTLIYRLSTTGVLEPIPFAGGLERASGLAFNPSGDTLYVTCRPLNGQGWVASIDSNGNVDTLVSGIYFPGDVVVAPNGDIYFNSFDNNVYRLTPNGTVSIHASSSQFNTPIGLAWTPGDTLFVASAHDGNIYKISPTNPPSVSWFAHVDGLVQQWACGFMVYSNGALFITNGDNKIHRIDMDGTVIDFAGTGNAGEVNGPFAQAEFEAPNGIGVNMSETQMFVTEYNKTRVRLLELGSTGFLETHPFAGLTAYPNPSSGSVVIEFQLLKNEDVTIDVLDNFGRRISTIQNGHLNVAEHSFVLDPTKLGLSTSTMVHLLIITNSTTRALPLLFRL